MTAPDLSLFSDPTASLSSDIPTHLFDLMPNGVAYCKMLYQDDKPHDFIYLYTNPAFHTITGLGVVKDQHVSDIIPGIRESSPELFKIYGAVAAGGLAQNFEIFIEGLQRWFSVQVFSPKPEHFVALLNAINQRKFDEQSLIISEKRYKSLLEDQTEMICRFKADGTILFVNQAFCRLFGKSPESLIGQTWHPVAWPEDIPLVNEKLNSLSPSNPVVTIENRIVTAGGILRWGQFVNRAFFDDEGVLLEMQSVGRDITELKQIELNLQSSDSRFRAFMDNSSFISWMKDEEGRHVYLSKCSEERFGFSFQDWFGKTDYDLFPHDIAEMFRQNDMEALRSSHPIVVEECNIDSDGRKSYWLNTKFSYVDSLGNRFVGGIGVDITERKQAEADLLDSKAKNQELSNHLEIVREEERKRIAREIHDELGSFLTVLNMDLSWLNKQLPKELTTCCEKTIEMMQKTQEGIQTVKRIITDLRPSILDHLGLIPAIEWLIESFSQRTGISCLLMAPEEDLIIDSQLSTAVFRITQEALMNILLHAKASEVKVCIKLLDKNLLMTIQDNGCGIAQGKDHDSSRYGISGMMERARHFGGNLTIVSQPKSGTTIHLKIPLPAPK